MAMRRDRNNRRTAPYPPPTTNPPPSISKFTPINAPLQIPLPTVGGPKTAQWGLKSHAALRDAPIGSSTVRMLVGDTTQQVPTTGGNAEDARNLEATLYDVDPDETAFGAPTAADLQYWTRSAARFIRSSSGIDATWVGRRPLGQGSFGIAGVWEKYDHNGNMVDTMVIKQIGVRPKDVMRGQPWESGIPHEVVIMRELNETNCDTIVKIKGYKRYPHQQIHRIYLEYCPYGDLRKLYKRYRLFRYVTSESYLWETFNQLLKAVIAMHFGPLDPTTGRRKWNYEIVHRDLKPQNVFLGDEASLVSAFPFYPTAKVGDFGLAERTSGLDPNNPRGLQGAGTRVYMAPEQKPRPDGVPAYFSDGRGLLGAHTNLWAVGATMYELLTLHHCYTALYPWEVDEEGEGLPVIRTTRTPEYSAELRQLIRMCLRPDPMNRPDFDVVNADVERRVAEITRASQRLRGNNQNAVHQDERLYYRGNEINTMPVGDWAPTHYYVLDDVEESGFKDPLLTSMRFPRWNRRGATEDEENSSQSDPDEDVKRIMASSMVGGGGTGATPQADVTMRTGATAQDDVTMGTDRTNNDGGEDEDEEDEDEDPTEVPVQPPPRAPLNKFGNPQMGW